VLRNDSFFGICYVGVRESSEVDVKETFVSVVNVVENARVKKKCTQIQTLLNIFFKI